MTPKEYVDRLRSDNERFYGDDRGRGALKDFDSWLYMAETSNGLLSVIPLGILS